MRTSLVPRPLIFQAPGYEATWELATLTHWCSVSSVNYVIPASLPDSHSTRFHCSQWGSGNETTVMDTVYLSPNFVALWITVLCSMGTLLKACENMCISPSNTLYPPMLSLAFLSEPWLQNWTFSHNNQLCDFNHAHSLNYRNSLLFCLVYFHPKKYSFKIIFVQTKLDKHN